MVYRCFMNLVLQSHVMVFIHQLQPFGVRFISYLPPILSRRSSHHFFPPAQIESFGRRQTTTTLLLKEWRTPFVRPTDPREFTFKPKSAMCHSVICWTSQKSDVENCILAGVLSPGPYRMTGKIKSLLDSITAMELHAWFEWPHIEYHIALCIILNIR